MASARLVVALSGETRARSFLRAPSGLRKIGASMSSPVRPSRLAFLLFDYFPFGGLQRDCVAIAKLCADRGHDVTILTRTWRGENVPGLKVKLFGRKGLTNEARNRHWLRQLQAELPEQKFDCVVGFNKLPGLDVYYGADPCYMAKA